MTRGPLRRGAGAIGLAALTPTGVMLTTGALSPTDAAIRAVATLGLVVVVGRLTDRSVQRLIGVAERSATDDREPATT